MPVSILLVDDDDGFRAALADTLRAAGHERVYEARTVAGALSAAAELRPDVALVDIGLPDGDGFQLACELGQLTDVPRVVLISTDADAADNAAAQRVGAERFLAKEDLGDARLRMLLSGP
ncbi:MAG TPA: response regulator [Solirubrobacteraceae bacterium]|nr:response regulator [Solirubrobacteraceae bacterium]